MGTSEFFFSGQAARDINPLIGIVGTTTYNIAGLQGGADVYGIMSAVNAVGLILQRCTHQRSRQRSCRARETTNIGPTGDHYLGEDHLLLVISPEAPTQ